MIRHWMRETFVVRVLEGSRTTILLWAAILIAAIAVVDWHFEDNISFGFLYLFPMLMVGGCLKRWQLAGVAAACTGLTEAFDPFPWVMPVGISRVILTFAAFFGMGFFGFASARSRRLATQYLGEIESEVDLRRKTEEQLEFLISSSPATIFTLDANGSVLLANEAAHRLLRVEKGNLQGESIAQFFPALASVPPSREEGPTFHTEMECQGRRQDGEVFLAHVWFSTYQTKSGPRLAAVVFDSSEELRDRAEFNLQQILTGSKVLVGALCHEIRNVCGAIAVVHSKLARDERLAVNEDFRALGTLVKGLEGMAGLELRQTMQSVAESVDVRSVLEELRIVIEPSFQESEMMIHWEIPESLPRVWADRQALLQAFLNVAKNSQRAMEGRDQRELTVRASLDHNSVTVRFIDTGSGVANPEQLFEPFQPGAQASGLGLYLSRTFVRAFQGDIEYEPQPAGCCFAVILALASEHQSGIAVGK
ncbi:MAG TPA: ATP-binding protein [Nitrospira sp.]|nr:ATP-binding protein [Nitrospira sp.]